MLFELDSLLWFDEAAMQAAGTSLQALEYRLTVYPRGFMGEAPEPVSMLQTAVEEDGRKLYGVPAVWGLKFFQRQFNLDTVSEFMGRVKDRRTRGNRTRYLTNLIEPRNPEQAEFFDQLYTQVKGRTGALVMAATGVGKTVGAMYAIARLGTTALAIVPNSRIVGQWIDAAKKFLGLEDSQIGYIGGGSRKHRWHKGCKVTVAIIHNLVDGEKLGDDFYTSFGLAIWDECLPAGTLVDGRPIEKIQAGDYVTSRGMDGSIVRRRVLATRKTEIRQKLYRLETEAGTVLHATANHKVWTPYGYTSIKDLQLGCAVGILRTQGEKGYEDRKMLRVCEDYPAGGEKGQGLCTQGVADILLRGSSADSTGGGVGSAAKSAGCSHGALSVVRGGGSYRNQSAEESNVQGNGGMLCRASEATRTQGSERNINTHGTEVQGAVFGAYEVAESNEERRCTQADIGDPQAAGSLSKGSRGEWQEDADSAGIATDSTRGGMGCGVQRENSCPTGQRAGAIHALQDRHCQSYTQDRRGSGRGVALPTCQEDTRHKETGVFGVERVASVAVVERGSYPGRADGCSKYYVYDLEVEGTHNFFANGILVHNCHICGARMFARSMLYIPALYRMGMSATPDRKDGCEKLFQYQFGQVCVTGQVEALATTVRVYDFWWQPENKMDSKPVFVKRKLVMASKRRNQWCAKVIHGMYKRGRHILVFSEEILHLQVLIGLCAELGIPDKDLGLYCRGYYNESGKSIPITDDDLDWVSENSRVIFTVYQMARDGLDIPRLDAGIDVYPRADGVQAIGRIRRAVEGKPEPLWITIRDKGIRSLEASCRKRIADYKKVNCNIVESGRAVC